MLGSYFGTKCLGTFEEGVGFATNGITQTCQMCHANYIQALKTMSSVPAHLHTSVQYKLQRSLNSS